MLLSVKFLGAYFILSLNSLYLYITSVLFDRNDGIVNVETNHPPPRSRRSSAHSNGGLDIPAASAVAGVLAASPELPYMTPPVTQANFSGDSQDSSSKQKLKIY